MMLTEQYFYDLRDLAKIDLSAAHLHQHFSTAHAFAQLGDISFSGNGSWSALKPNDTVEYTNQSLTGKKHWVSGVSLCDWFVLAAKENTQPIIVFAKVNDCSVEPAVTTGMENTVTAHLLFDRCPAVKIINRHDSRCCIIDSCHDLAFLTNTVGLTQSLFNDIDLYTQSNFNYKKDKLKLDIDMLELLWQSEISTLSNPVKDQDAFWQRRLKIYAFAKKTLISVTNFVTEVTGSGLFEPWCAGHQRYKDALIYSSHQRNLPLSVKNIYHTTSN